VLKQSSHSHCETRLYHQALARTSRQPRTHQTSRDPTNRNHANQNIYDPDPAYVTTAFFTIRKRCDVTFPKAVAEGGGHRSAVPRCWAKA
jgi:hypothetical protein